MPAGIIYGSIIVGNSCVWFNKLDNRSKKDLFSGLNIVNLKQI